MVSQNVTVAGFQELEDSLVPKQGISINEIPASSVVAPQGTVLFGNRAGNTNKRLKLQIFYTEPE